MIPLSTWEVNDQVFRHQEHEDCKSGHNGLLAWQVVNFGPYPQIENNGAAQLGVWGLATFIKESELSWHVNFKVMAAAIKACAKHINMINKDWLNLEHILAI